MRKFIAVTLVVILACSFSACGISQEDYDAVKDQCKQAEQLNESLSADLSSAKEELKKAEDSLADLEKANQELQTEYDQLKADTADWVTLTDEQKAAELAQAEADRIAAEAEAQKAKEEKEAAEKAKAEEEARRKEEERKAQEEKEKKGYDTGITYNDLARKPDNFEGEKVKFKGQVLQVLEADGIVQIRLATKKDRWGNYLDDIVYVFFDAKLIDSRILDDDIITVYGISQGLYTYETVMGNSITLPLIKVDKVDQ